MGVRGRGDLVRVAGAVVGTASMSFGLAARASMLVMSQNYEECSVWKGQCVSWELRGRLLKDGRMKDKDCLVNRMNTGEL